LIRTFVAETFIYQVGRAGVTLSFVALAKWSGQEMRWD